MPSRAFGFSRNRAIAEAYRSGAYSMQVIAEHFGVSRMTVSRAVKRFETERSSSDVSWVTPVMRTALGTTRSPAAISRTASQTRPFTVNGQLRQAFGSFKKKSL